MGAKQLSSFLVPLQARRRRSHARDTLIKQSPRYGTAVLVREMRMAQGRHETCELKSWISKPKWTCFRMGVPLRSVMAGMLSAPQDGRLARRREETMGSWWVIGWSWALGVMLWPKMSEWNPWGVNRGIGRLFYLCFWHSILVAVTSMSSYGVHSYLCEKLERVHRRAVKED